MFISSDATVQLRRLGVFNLSAIFKNIGLAAKECTDKLQSSEQKLTETFSKEQAELYREQTIDQDIYIGMTNLEAFRRGLRIGVELMIAIGKGRIE